VSFRIKKMRRLHGTAFRHGISAADIEHVLKHPMRVIERDDRSFLYLGPGRNAELLEVITVLRADETELAIHAMKIRLKYANLLPRE
jgi:hypothetical protein